MIAQTLAAGTSMEALAEILLRNGHCDARTLERGRRMAGESGQRLDVVLIQLGLVTERGLAEAYSALLDLPVAGPGRYPNETLLGDRISQRFLRQARAIPVALEDGALALALADPFDQFTPSAVSAAIGLPVKLEIAVPIELDAALNRLYPAENDTTAPDQPELAEETYQGGALEEDAERLKDMASEAPIIRLVN